MFLLFLFSKDSGEVNKSAGESSLEFVSSSLGGTFTHAKQPCYEEAIVSQVFSENRTRILVLVYDGVPTGD